MNMVGIPTRTSEFRFCQNFQGPDSPKETGLCREQTETNVTVPVKLPNQRNL